MCHRKWLSTWHTYIDIIMWYCHIYHCIHCHIIHYKIAYNNVCSVKTKIHDKQAGNNLKYSDILCLSETWLHYTEDINKYTLQDYTIHTDMVQENVSSTAHYGLLMYVQKNVQIIERQKYPGISWKQPKCRCLSNVSHCGPACSIFLVF